MRFRKNYTQETKNLYGSHHFNPTKYIPYMVLLEIVFLIGSNSNTVTLNHIWNSHVTLLLCQLKNFLFSVKNVDSTTTRKLYNRILKKLYKLLYCFSHPILPHTGAWWLIIMPTTECVNYLSPKKLIEKFLSQTHS